MVISNGTADAALVFVTILNRPHRCAHVSDGGVVMANINKERLFEPNPPDVPRKA